MGVNTDIGSVVLGVTTGTVAVLAGLSAPLVIGSAVGGTYLGSKFFKYESAYQH